MLLRLRGCNSIWLAVTLLSNFLSGRRPSFKRAHFCNSFPSSVQYQETTRLDANMSTESVYSCSTFILWECGTIHTHTNTSLCCYCDVIQLQRRQFPRKDLMAWRDEARFYSKGHVSPRTQVPCTFTSTKTSCAVLTRVKGLNRLQLHWKLVTL